MSNISSLSETDCKAVIKPKRDINRLKVSEKIVAVQPFRILLLFLYEYKILNMEFSKEFINRLFEEAAANPRLRTNVDMRNSAADASQRMLNALLPGTKVDIHRHPMSAESVICLCGKLDEVMYDDNGKETGRIHLSPTDGLYGCQIPAGAWHTVEVFEPSVIFEAKDGRYGEDGSERL